MFKHSAISIKESQEKRFISLADKERYNAIQDKCLTIEDSYSKEEIEERVFNRLIGDIATVDTSVFPTMVDHTEKGYFTEIEIFGNTERDCESKYITPTFETGTIDSSTGESIDASDIKRTIDYIEVKEGDILKFYAVKQGTQNAYSNVGINIAMYDKNKKFISSSDLVLSFEIPSGVAYIRGYLEKNDRAGINHFTLISKNNTLRSLGELQSNGLYKINLKTTGKNLFNVLDVKNNASLLYDNGSYTIKNNSVSEKVIILNHSIKVKPNTKYTIIADYELDENCVKAPEMYVYAHTISCEDIPDLWKLPYSVNHTDGRRVYRTFETDIDINYIRIRMDNNGSTEEGLDAVSKYSNIMIYEGEYDPEIEYEEYIEQNTYIYLPFPLQKCGDVADKLYINANGNICVEKNIKTATITSDNSLWVQHSLPSNYDANCGLFFLHHDQNEWLDIQPETKIVSNIVDNSHYSYGGYGIYNGSVAIALQIQISKLPYANIVGFYEWLKSNPIELSYVSTNPEVIEFNNDVIMLKSFEGCTNILCDRLQPSRLKCKAAIDLGSSLSMNTEKVSELRNEVDDLKTLTKELSYNIESDNRIMKLTSNGEIIDNIEIQGKTIRNALSEKYYTAPELVLENTGTGTKTAIFNNINSGSNSKLVVKDGYITLTKNDASNNNYSNMYIRRDMFNVKPDTIYTYIVEILENTMVRSNGQAVLYLGDTLSADINSVDATIFNPGKAYNELINGVAIYSGDVGMFKTLVCTRPKSELDTMGPDRIGDRVFVHANASGTIKFRVALLEGNHMDSDITNIYPKFVSVMSNQSNLNMKINNVNLLDIHAQHYPHPTTLPYSIVGNKLTIGDGVTSLARYANVSYLVYLEKDVTYDIKYAASKPISGSQNVVDIKYIGKNADATSVYLAGTPNTSSIRFTASCGDGWYRISFYCTGSTEAVAKMVIEDIGLYEVGNSDINIIYEANKNREKILNLSNYGVSYGLNSLPSGVCDRVYKNNAKYYLEQNIDVITLTEDQVQDNLYLVNTYGDWMQVGIPVTYITSRMKQVVDVELLCDVFPSYNNTSDKKKFSVYTAINNKGIQTLYFRLPISMIGELSLETAREFLLKNLPTVYYQLQDPVIIELKEDLDFILYDGFNRIESHCNGVIPKLIVNKSGTLQNTVNSLLTDIKKLSSTEVASARLALDSMYTGEVINYSIEIMETSVLSSVEHSYNQELFELIYGIISSGKDNYDVYDMEEKIDFFCVIDKLSFDMCTELLDMIASQQVEVEL